jgi:POT family proton-dependent oligopeptide transporter
MNGNKSLTPATGEDTAFFGHPRGLSTLFFTEMWERFSYYGMRAILILYMTAAVSAGGLGYSDSQGGLVYGLYVGIVYLLSLPGGWIADRFLGQRKAVFYGGIGIMFGHICLAIPLKETFFAGLVIICLGTGLLKPNVSTIVGQLYTPEDKRRDAGFSLYYMGINLGAFLGPLVCGFLAESETFRAWLKSAGITPHQAWHFGFGAAAVGMFFGVIQYVLGNRRLREAGLHPVPPADATEAARNRRLLRIIILGLIGLPVLIAGIGATGILELTRTRITYGVLVLLLLISTGLFVAMFTMAKWTPDERKRIVALVLLFFGAASFFFVFEQAGSTFNLFAQRNTENAIFGISFPASYLQSANAIMIIVFAPIFAVLWTALARRGTNPAWPLKFGVGMVLVAVGCLIMLPAATSAQAGVKSGPGWLLLLYLFHTFAELCISPVGLSATTKVAPTRIAGLAMGIWFAGTGVGNYMSGVAAGWTEDLSLPALFAVISAPPLLAGLIFFALVRPMRRLVKEP